MEDKRKVYEDTILQMLVQDSQYSQTYMFYGYLLAQCQLVIDESIPTAGVHFWRDHYVLTINPDFFNSLPLVERMGILCHECMHIMNNHVARKELRDHQKFNYAADCAINQSIDRDHLPKGCIYPDNFPTKLKDVPTMKTAEQYYDIMDIDPDEDDQNGQGNGIGKVLDDHNQWDKSEGDADLVNDITKEMLDKSIAQTTKSRGNVPAEAGTALELFSRKSEVDWRKVLRNVVGNKKTNSRRTIMRADRRLPTREDLRGKTKDRIFELAVVSDVSGSVSDKALLELLAEVRHICEMARTSVTLVQVDTTPSEPEELKASTKIIKRKACGGTFLSPAIQKLKDAGKKFDALVVTTDGYLDSQDVADFEALRKKVIWLIEKDGQVMDQMDYGLMKAFKLKD